MIGWLTILKTVLGLSGKIFNKFKYQKDIQQKNKIKELNYKLRTREIEREALEKYS